MGASFDYVEVEAKDFSEASKRFNKACEESRYMNGREYSGCIGMKDGCVNTNKVFNTGEEAMHYIEENNEKWDSATAVRFKASGRETTASQNARKKHNEKVGKARENLGKLKSQIETEIATAKSEFKACRHCKSKVNKKYIRNSACPVCHTDMLSPTQQNRLHRLELKLQEAETARENFKPKYTGGGKKEKWLIGGWCSA